MTVQVLASVMNEEPMALIRRMGLESDAVIINQCDRLGAEEIHYGGHRGRSAFSRTGTSCMSQGMPRLWKRNFCAGRMQI